MLLNVDSMKKLNEKGEIEMKNEIFREKNLLQQQLHALQERFINMEDSSKDLERNTLFENSEF